MSFILSVNRPAADCDPHAIHIGPTAIDFSPLDDAATAALLRRTEARILAADRARDLAHYSHQTQRAGWRH